MIKNGELIGDDLFDTSVIEYPYLLYYPFFIFKDDHISNSL